MSKLDRSIRDGGAAAAESMGAGVPVVHNAPRPGPTPVSAQLDGISRVKNVASIPVGKIDRDPHQPREEPPKKPSPSPGLPSPSKPGVNFSRSESGGTRAGEYIRSSVARDDGGPPRWPDSRQLAQ